MRSSHKPIFVANREFKPITKVLIAFDGRQSSVKAVEFLARNGLVSGLPVTLAYAGLESAEIRKALERARAVLASGGLDVETVTENGKPEAALSRLVEERAFDFLVMGAYGHSRIRSLLIGSTTSEMLRSCKIPILLMR